MRLDEALTEGSGVYFEGTLIEALQTPYQLIEIFDTPTLGKLMRIDGANMTSEGDEFFYHECLVHPAAIAHTCPRSVLVIGGGDGGACEEILKHPSVDQVVLAELDEGVIEMAKRHLSRVHRNVFANPRLVLRIVDGVAFIQSTSEHFDLIYLDLTDPVGPAVAIYSRAFFGELKQALSPGGALVLHIGSPFSHPARVASSVADLRVVFERVTTYFTHIPTYGATWGFAIASETIDPLKISAVEVEHRLDRRGVTDRQFYNGGTHHAMLALPGYIKSLFG